MMDSYGTMEGERNDLFLSINMVINTIDNIFHSLCHLVTRFLRAMASADCTGRTNI